MWTAQRASREGSCGRVEHMVHEQGGASGGDSARSHRLVRDPLVLMHCVVHARIGQQTQREAAVRERGRGVVHQQRA